MDQQAQAIAQVAQATHSNSKALEKLADASHVQVTLIINSRFRVGLHLSAHFGIDIFIFLKSKIMYVCYLYRIFPLHILLLKNY